MPIAKVATLALTTISLQLIGCASESTTSSTDEPTPPPATTATSTSQPKQTLSAPLPSNDTKASGEVTVDAPAPNAGDDADRGSTPVPAAPPPPPPPPPKADPGPAPTATCTVTKDSLGFFTRTSAKSDYVAYVPASYDKSKPTRVIVGMHGCGDNALNFAKWAMNPWDTRATQQHIGISVSGETGANKCWNKGGDDDKVLAAVDDLAKCFWVDRTKVVVAGYSSGGELAYRVGLKHADRFAGILIENSSISSAGDPPQSLLANATWKINIAHSAHTGDTVFPIATVKADWSAIRSAGFPLKTEELPGTHDGDGKEWANWLIPASSAWTKP